MRLTCFALALLLLAPLSAVADIYDDARTIIASKNDTIRRWEYAPTIAVLHDRDFHFDSLQTLTDRIASATHLNFQTLKRYNLAEGYDLSQGVKFRFANRRGPRKGDVTAKLSFAANHILADILVAFLPRPQLALLTTYTEADSKLSRQVLEGGAPCFFHMRSKHDNIQQVNIFIADDVSNSVQEACIYEEFMQAMGFLRDAVGTPHFTFDDDPDAGNQINDFKLLRALYDPRVSAGSPVNDVLQLFKTYHEAALK